MLSKGIYLLTSADATPMDILGITKSYAYTYGNESWGDQLTKYRGASLTYDAIGNPLRYYNGIVYTMQWKNGRLLDALSRGESELLFEYNADGIRTGKTVNGVEHKYQVDGTKIISESYQDYLFVYLYDANNRPIGFRFRTSSYAEGEFDTYWFEKNLQGDIIAVYNENGIKLVTYTYDAWGNCTTEYFNGGSGTMAAQNPFRYRGYYWDSISGFYYLNSRYYDPVIGRFINADGFISTGQGILSNNMYAYCRNSPIMWYDPTGYVEVDNMDNNEDDTPINDFGPVNTGHGSTQNSGGGGQGFSSHSQMTRAIGSAGSGNEWHHIVEQSQIAKSGFSPEMIHNTNNVIPIDKATHRAISGYYSSKPPFANGMTVRNWLAGQSYAFQYQYGIDIVNKYTNMNLIK